MARSAGTYRAARRNVCIRELKSVWGPSWYHSKHRANYLTHDECKTRSSARKDADKARTRSLRDMTSIAAAVTKTLVHRFTRGGVTNAVSRARSAGRGT